jgi:hypothetical protein
MPGEEFRREKSPMAAKISPGCTIRPRCRKRINARRNGGWMEERRAGERATDDAVTTETGMINFPMINDQKKRLAVGTIDN